MVRNRDTEHRLAGFAMDYGLSTMDYPEFLTIYDVLYGWFYALVINFLFSGLIIQVACKPTVLKYLTNKQAFSPK